MFDVHTYLPVAVRLSSKHRSTRLYIVVGTIYILVRLTYVRYYICGMELY